MDVESVFNAGGVVIPNPNYTKSKKNTQPKYITVTDLDKAKDGSTSHLADVSYSTAQQGLQGTIMPYDEAKKYLHYGIVPNRWETNLDEQLANAQSAWTKFGNALAQAVISEVALGTVKGISDLVDLVGCITGLSDDDYTNPVSQYLEEKQEEFRNFAPIYTTPGVNISNGGLVDAGWWASNLPSVMSSLTLLIPSTGIVKGASYLGKIGKVGSRTRQAMRAITGAEKRLKAAQAAKAAGASMEEVAQIGKLNKVQKFLTANSTARQTAIFLENGMTATLSRAMENYQEARQTYNDMYVEASDYLKDDKNYEQFVNNNAERLQQAGIDINNRDEVAKYVATSAADRTFQMDWLNVGFDVIQMYGLRNAWKGFKSAETNPTKVRRANIDAARYAGKTADEIKAIKASHKFGVKAKEWAEDRLYASKLIVGAQLSEGVEEAVNYIASEEGMRFGRVMFGKEIGENHGTWSNIMHGFDGRLHEYLQAPELWDSAFWGIMGGIIFQGLGSQFNRVTEKIKNSKSEANKRAEENTPWYVLGDLPENKRRIAEIHARTEDLKTYQDKLKQINEGKDIYNTDENGEVGSFSSESAQQAARDKLKDEFITKMTIRAMNAGNFDLLKTYMQDENLRKAFVESGMFATPNETRSQSEQEQEAKAYIEDAVRRMDEVAKMYDEEILALDYASAQIGKERGFGSSLLGEYLQIIATNNVNERIGLRNQQSDLAIINDRIEDLIALNYDKLDPNIDYEGSIRLGVLTNMLGQLRAQRKRVLADGDTLSNRIAIQNIDKQIKSIEDSLTDAQLMFATQHSLRYMLNDDGSYSQLDTPESLQYRDAMIVRRGEQEIGNILFNDNKDFNDVNARAREVFDDATFGEFEVLNQNANTTFTQLKNISLELDNLYKRKVVTEKSIDITKSNIVRTVDEVEHKANILHNTMNEARQNAINTANETILRLYDKYGQNIWDAIIYDYNNKSNRYNEEVKSLSESEKKDLSDALKVLQLTKAHNKPIIDILENQFRLIDEVNAAREVTDEEVSDNETSEENATNLQGDTSTINPDLDNYTGTEVKATDEPQSSQNDDVSEQIDPQNISNRTPSFYGNSFNNKGNFTIKTQKEDKGNLAFYDNGDDTFTVDVRGELAKLNSTEFFGNTNSVDLTRPYEVLTMPIAARDERGNLRIIQKGELRNTDTLEYQEEKQAEETIQPENVEDNINPTTEQVDQTEQTDATNPSTGGLDSQVEQMAQTTVTTEQEVNPVADEVLIETPSTEDEIRNSSLGEFQKAYKENHDVDLDAVAQSLIDNYVKQGFDRAIAEAAVNKSKNIIKRVIERRKNGTKATMDSSIDEVIVEQINPLEKAYKDAVNNMIAQYAKEFGLVKHNGKYYVNLEDLLRFVNEISQDSTSAKNMFNALKDYLDTDEAKQSFVITDSNETNNANFLDNVAKSSTERYLERLGENNSQKVDIQSIIDNLASEEEADRFYQVLETLNVGDKLSYTVDNGKIILRTKEGKAVGVLPIPKINPITGAYQMINDGWVTDILVDNNGNVVSKLKDTFRSWFDESNEAAKELNDIILEFAYSKSNETRKKELIAAFNNNLEIKKARTNGLISSTASNERLLNGLAKLWKYKTFNADTRRTSRNINIKNSFNSWFANLAKSYDGVRALANNEVKEVTISDISQGEIIRATDETGKSLQEAALPISKAIVGGPNPSVHKVALVRNNIIIGSEIPSIPFTTRNNNNTFVLMPNHNGNYDYVQAVPANITDDYIGQDAKDIISSIHSHIQELFNKYNNERTEENYNEIKDFVLRLFEKGGMFFNVRAGSNGSVLWFELGNGSRRIAFKSGKGTIDITHPEFEKNDKGFKQKSISLDSPEAYRHIKEIINHLRFNMYAAGIKSDSNTRTPLNGLASRTKDGKFQIKIGDKIWTYDSYNEFVLKNDLFRINTKPNKEGTSNYSRRGLRSQKGNQILRITLDTTTSTPVEGKQDTTVSGQAPTNIPINTQLDTILSPNSNSTNKGLDIAKLIFDNATINIFEKLNILPKNIIFDETLNNKQGEETTNAFININTGNVTVGKRWVELFKNPNTRNRAIRILIHEQLHGILHSENGKNKGYITSAQEIYDEFKKYLDDNNIPADDHIREYLFANEHPTVALEEFLVESLTNQELADYLNSIDADVTKKPGARNLFQRILEFLSDIFGWNVREGSLYEKELHTLKSAFNTTIETVQTEEVQEETTTEQELTETDNNEQVNKTEDLNPVNNPYGEDYIDEDFDEFESSIEEVVTPKRDDSIDVASNIPSIQSMQDRLLPEQRAKFASLVSSAAIQSSCK